MIAAPPGYFLISVCRTPGGPYCTAQVVIGWERDPMDGKVKAIILGETLNNHAWDQAIELPNGGIVDLGSGTIEFESRDAFLEAAFAAIAEDEEVPAA